MQTTALNYSEETRTYENAWKYGQYFYIATLSDGRDVGFSADKVLVTDTGDLIALSSSFHDEKLGRIPGETKTILCLAKGQWISFYAASTMTGDPVGIDWIAGTKS